MSLVMLLSRLLCSIITGRDFGTCSMSCKFLFIKQRTVIATLSYTLESLSFTIISAINTWKYLKQVHKLCETSHLVSTKNLLEKVLNCTNA